MEFILTLIIGALMVSWIIFMGYGIILICFKLAKNVIWGLFFFPKMLTEKQARQKAYEKEQTRRWAAERQARRNAEEAKQRYEEEQTRKQTEKEQARQKTEEEQRKYHSVVNEEIQKCFSFFELPASATLDDVKRKYKIMIKLFHPDKHSTDDAVRKYANQKTKELNNAFEILKTKHFKM